MIKRKDKIKYLTKLYEVEIASMTDDAEKFTILNQIIIDSIGISGLKVVKKRAWNTRKTND